MSDLTIAEIADHLSRISYRPGWRFEVYTGRYEGNHIAIYADLPDSENPGKTISVRIDSSLPPFRTAEDFERWLLWRLNIIGSHENREFLRVDGEMVSDPHAPNAQHDL